MCVLAKFLEEISRQPTDSAISVPGLSVDNFRVIVRSLRRAAGMSKSNPNAFEWSLDRETAMDFSEKVSVLGDCKSVGHQYLECGTPGEICVMVSCGEYPDKLQP